MKICLKVYGPGMQVTLIVSVLYFNVDLNNCSDDVARYINSFIRDCGFYRYKLTTYHCKPKLP